MRGRAGLVRQVRRQTRRRTSVELHRLLSRSGRKWVKEVWEAADQASRQGSLLSPLAAEVGRGLAASYANSERLEGAELKDALIAAIRAGYAARTVVAGPTEQPSMDPSKFGLGRSADPEALATDPGSVNGLVDAVRGIAVKEFEQVMTLPEEVWGGFAAVAAMRLQRRLSVGPITWRELTRGRIEAMLLRGYVLACLDDALHPGRAVVSNPSR